MTATSTSLPPLVLAHDYLVHMGGAERVVAAMHRAHPAAPIYTSGVSRNHIHEDFDNADIRTTWMQRLLKRGDFRKYYFLFPYAFRSIPPVRAKAAWISASTFAKCLRTAPGTPSICYCHAPTRFLWQFDRYKNSEILSRPLVRRAVVATLPYLRRLDVAAAGRMTHFVANSVNVQRQIKGIYGRDATVIHPPVEIDRFTAGARHEGYYLIVSRLIEYKRIDTAVQAFSRLGKKLVIVGDGPERLRLEEMAGATVDFRGRLPDHEVNELLHDCRALVFPGEEDFGIVAVEALASGKPVLALDAGGARETVQPGVNGWLFPESTPESLCDGVARIEGQDWDADAIRRSAVPFGEPAFVAAMNAFIEQVAPGATGGEMAEGLKG